MTAVNHPIYEFGPFHLEPRAQLLYRRGEVLPLMSKEFEMLLLLVRNRGRLISKNEIMDAVWPDSVVEENNLTVRMSSLRKALGETKGYHPYIQTVSGRGYRFIAPVKELAAEQEDTADASHQAGADTESPSERDSGVALPAPTEDRQREPITARPQLNPSGPSDHRSQVIRRPRLYVVMLGTVLATLAINDAWRHYTRDEPHASTQAMKMRRLTQSGQVSVAAVSPDGQYIAYVQREGGEHSLWLQRADSGKPFPLLPPAKLFYKDLAFSRDGNSLYYLKCQPDCALYRMPILGGVETMLVADVQSPVTFSPDGKRMAFVRVHALGFDLVSTNTDGAAEEVLRTHGRSERFTGGTPAWSPDGKMIAYAVGVTEGNRNYAKVIGVRVADRAEATISGQGWRFIKDVAWLPGGSSLIINARDEASSPALAVQIWQISYPQGAAHRITNDLNNYTRIALSADGSTLIALEDDWSSSIWVASAASTAKAMRVTRGTSDRHDGNLGLSWTPAGGIVYVSDTSGRRDIWSAGSDGLQPTQLTDGRHTDYFPTVSPDGRYIVFESSSDGAHNIWRMDVGGRNLRRLTRGVYDSEAQITPDAKWVIYVSQNGESPTLWKVPIEGGEPVALTEEFSLHPTLSPDGGLVAYYRRDPKRQESPFVVLIPASGGPAIKRIPAPQNMGSVIQWTPDGNSLTYVDNELANIWLLPLDGAQPNPVTSLQNERMFRFAWSHDGRRLAYASGHSTSDVVLIRHFN